MGVVYGLVSLKCTLLGWVAVSYGGRGEGPGWFWFSAGRDGP